MEEYLNEEDDYNRIMGIFFVLSCGNKVQARAEKQPKKKFELVQQKKSSKKNWRDKIGPKSD